VSSDTYGPAIPAVVVVGLRVCAIRAKATGVFGRTTIIAVATGWIDASAEIPASSAIVYGNI
jgi:hypothetical protein